MGFGGVSLLLATQPSQPTLAEPLPVATAATVPPVTPTADQVTFIEQVGAVARRLRTQVAVPPSLVTAMAINESGWGRSTLSQRAHNYFGIKAEIGTGTAGRVVEETQEVVNGRVITVQAPFRAYYSLEESVRDLGAFLRDNPRYAALGASLPDPRQAAAILAQAGYATDPAWPDKLVTLIDQFQLERFDRQV
jgi:flagellum-specific peptidoglycan hydrolase FlgJ